MKNTSNLDFDIFTLDSMTIMMARLVTFENLLQMGGEEIFNGTVEIKRLMLSSWSPFRQSRLARLAVLNILTLVNDGHTSKI